MQNENIKLISMFFLLLLATGNPIISSGSAADNFITSPFMQKYSAICSKESRSSANNTPFAMQFYICKSARIVLVTSNSAPPAYGIVITKQFYKKNPRLVEDFFDTAIGEINKRDEILIYIRNQLQKKQTNSDTVILGKRIRIEHIKKTVSINISDKK
jgi:hypothetical protein